MSLQSTSDLWQKYASHVLSFEGKLSNDQDDTAASCNPGLYHTNKGVTYCTFKANARSLGILPVTYDRFLKLTEGDAAKFMYKYYKNVKGDQLPDTIAIQMTEAAWGSGPDVANSLLMRSLSDIGTNVGTISEAYKAANKADESQLFNAMTKRRYNWLNTLSDKPKYKKYKNGWLRRQTNLINTFTGAAKKKTRTDYINFNNFIKYLFG